MALELAIISIVAGIALGLRYKVLILVPAAALVMVFAMIVGIGRADPLSSIHLGNGGIRDAGSIRLLGGNRDTWGIWISHPSPACASGPTARAIKTAGAICRGRASSCECPDSQN